ncbi:MAG: Glu-tRNA(Gln) amidotransferase subunit GatD [Candidatus Bathyarchaeia archaeon]
MKRTEELSGYKGRALKLLEDKRVRVGDVIRVKKDGGIYEGVLMPRMELGNPECIVLKLKSGYNTGILVTAHTHIEFVSPGSKPAFIPPKPPAETPELPPVAIVSTGGTIASRVDYRTGAVNPALTAEDLYSVIPELSKIARIRAEILFSLLSENITPKHWSRIAEAVAKHIEEGASGVVVAHGTDTMGYTAAALSFALRNLPVPVILVGSQRSSDRPSTDAAMNLMGAVNAAASAPFAEVGVAMHEGSSDDSTVIHRGTKVRKCHTSCRYAFRSVNAGPLARVVDRKITMLTSNFNPRDPNRKLKLEHNFNEKVYLLKVYPGIQPTIFEWLIDQRYLGIVIEGTGLGHIGESYFKVIEEAVKRGIVVAMTSQCIWGRVNMAVYETGRDLLKLGVVPLGDMLPETALVKMMWIFGQTTYPEEVKRRLLTNIAGEFSPRLNPAEESYVAH